MIVKVFTMIKNEVDIIEHWIKYHGYIFGYENLYILDNNSDDGTWEIIEKYGKEYNFYYEKHDDYITKGIAITNLIKTCNHFDIALPLDIDEFIVFYDDVSKKIDPNGIIPYLYKLIQVPEFHSNTEFKANYIQSVINNKTDYGYEDAILETTYGIHQDYGKMAKTFVNMDWNGQLDHGNHCPSDKYILTKLCLIHFHCRNKDQMKKKVEMNVTGLGYPANDLEFLKELPDGSPGYHHVQHMINILENTFEINTNICGSEETGLINLTPFSDFIKNL